MRLARKAMHKGNSLVANRWLRTAGLAQKLPPEPEHGDQSGYVETPEAKAAREALIRRLDQLIGSLGTRDRRGGSHPDPSRFGKRWWTPIRNLLTNP